MKVVLNDRTDGLPPALKAYAERKLTRLERHFGKVADAVVDFSEEHKRFGLATIVCRINVHVNGRRTPVLSAHERGVDAQSALDLARTPEPERIRVKLLPQSTEQAIADLVSDGEAFHIYLDEFSGGIQIAFRRADGTVAIIEPVIT